MVKVGFITEGKADKILLTSDRFKKYLFHKHSIEFDDNDIRYFGGKSLIKKHFKSLLAGLNKTDVAYIFIMIDQDDKEDQRKNRKYKPKDCPLVVVEEIKNFGENHHYLQENLIFVVMTREMEAWFLADPNLNFDCNGQEPEIILNPSDLVAKQLGTCSHGRIAHKIKDKFSLERAAQNAPSAQRFLDKLIYISQQ